MQDTQTYGKGPHPLLWGRSRVTRGKITVSGIPNSLNYCVSFIVRTEFTNVGAGHIVQPGAPPVIDPRFQQISSLIFS